MSVTQIDIDDDALERAMALAQGQDQEGGGQPGPKNAGRWIRAVPHRMAQAGEHRSASAVDLVIAATAAHHGLAVLHDDADYRAIARYATDLLEHNVRGIA